MTKEITSKKLLRKNLRFTAYSAFLGNERVFIKTTKRKKLYKRLRREVMGLQIMVELDPTAKLYSVPKVIDFRPETLTTTWASGTLLSNTIFEPSFEENLQKLVDLYIFIDSKTTSDFGITVFNTPGKVNAVDKLLKKIDKLEGIEAVNSKYLIEIAKFAREHLPQMETRFAHGDLQPANILIDKGKFTIIDCESCSFLWPRHYEIINFVFNYSFEYPTQTELFNSAILSYFSQLNTSIESQITLLNTIAATRWLSIIVEKLSNHTHSGKKSLTPDQSKRLNRIAENIISNKFFWEV